MTVITKNVTFPGNKNHPTSSSLLHSETEDYDEDLDVYTQATHEHEHDHVEMEEFELSSNTLTSRNASGDYHALNDPRRITRGRRKPRKRSRKNGYFFGNLHYLIEENPVKSCLVLVGIIAVLGLFIGVFSPSMRPSLSSSPSSSVNKNATKYARLKTHIERILTSTILPSIPHLISKPYTYSIFDKNISISDPFEWVRSKWSTNSSNIIQLYIQQENEYTAQLMMKPTVMATLQTDLVKEMRQWEAFGAVGKNQTGNDCALPSNVYTNFFEWGDYVYWKDESGQQPVYYRREILPSPSSSSCQCTLAAPNSIIEKVIDLNSESILKRLQPNTVNMSMIPSLTIGVFEVAPFDQSLLAFSVDFVGHERFDLYFWNITSQSFLPTRQPIHDTYYSLIWLRYSSNAYWVYYNVLDPVKLVPNKINKACVFGCNASDVDRETLVYREMDERLVVDVVQGSARSDGSVGLLKISGQVTSEYRLIDVTSGTISPIFLRKDGVLYDVEYDADLNLFIRTNARVPNFEVIRVPWKTISSTVHLVDFLASNSANYSNIASGNGSTMVMKLQMFENTLVAWCLDTNRGLKYIHGFSLGSSPSLSNFTFKPWEQSSSSNYSSLFAMFPGSATSMEDRLYGRYSKTNCLLFTMSSFVDLPHRWAINFSNGSAERIESDYNRTSRYSKDLHTKYQQQRIWTLAGYSGVSVPMDIVLATSSSNLFKPNGTFTLSPRPVLVITYSAYGDITEAAYNPLYFPLLDRSMMIVHCHARGSSLLGSQWYESGKGLFKNNTFADTQACIRELLKRNMTTKGSIGIMGRSAGGLVPGYFAATQSDSEDLGVKAIIAQVPFLDVIGDLRDPDVPWTAYEYEEWGNPDRDLRVLESMLSYSPYHLLSHSTSQKKLLRLSNSSYEFNTSSISVPSPVKHKDFASTLVMTGLADMRVQAWEPIKFVAKMRSMKRNNVRVVIHALDMEPETDSDNDEETHGFPKVLDHYHDHQQQPVFQITFHHKDDTTGVKYHVKANFTIEGTPLLLSVYQGGHFGNNGKKSNNSDTSSWGVEGRLEQRAFWYAFLLTELGLP